MPNATHAQLKLTNTALLLFIENWESLYNMSLAKYMSFYYEEKKFLYLVSKLRVKREFYTCALKKKTTWFEFYGLVAQQTLTCHSWGKTAQLLLTVTLNELACTIRVSSFSGMQQSLIHLCISSNDMSKYVLCNQCK